MGEATAIFTLAIRSRKLKSALRRTLTTLSEGHTYPPPLDDKAVLAEVGATSPAAAAVLASRIADLEEARSWLREALTAKERQAFDATWIFGDYAGERLWLKEFEPSTRAPPEAERYVLASALVPDDVQSTREHLIVSWMRSYDLMLFIAFMRRVFAAADVEVVGVAGSHGYEDDEDEDEDDDEED